VNGEEVMSENEKQPSQIREEELGLVEDGDAMFKSILWYEAQRTARNLAQYEGMHIAILGEEIIDSDKDRDELYRRLDARRGSINWMRVVTRYVSPPRDGPIPG
jgi:hypothetical protein